MSDSGQNENTELEQALRTARDIAKNQIAYQETFITLARVFLAQHERLEEVERERDTFRDALWSNRRQVNEWSARAEAAESRLADAERRGAREALTRLANEARLVDLRPHIAQHIAAFRDREYPAPSPVGGDRPATPQAAPEPLVIPLTRETDHFTGITLTPELCQRIVEMARPAPEPPQSCDFVDLMVEESSSGPFVRVKARHIAALLARAARPTGEG